jgi:plastocyanin
MVRQTARTWSVILVLAWVTPTHAGVIRGIVKIPSASSNPKVALVGYPGRAGSLPQETVARRRDVADAIISIEAIPAAVESVLVRRPGAVPALAQKNQTFVPRVLAVAVGTTIEFPNLDPIFHNAFSVSPVKRFDLGKYPRGQSRRVLFNKQGLVEVYCDIHADMAAFVLILPNHAFTQANARGRFELPELPPGEYALRVWHPDLREVRRSVLVPAGGDVEVEIGF